MSADKHEGWDRGMLNLSEESCFCVLGFFLSVTAVHRLSLKNT